MTRDDPHGAWPASPSDELGSLALDELVVLGDALERRVRDGTATLEDFGALARTRRELALRAEAERRARCRGGSGPL